MGRESEAEVLGKDDYDLFPKEMADKFIADDRYVIQTGRPLIDREEYVVDVKGQKHFLLTTKLPFRDEQGQIIGLIGIGHDITERKRAEEALQESNEKLRNIVEHSTNLFYSRNTDQVFTYLSPQTRDIFDCEPDEALIRFTDFITDNPINKLGCELAEKVVWTGLRQETYELELMSRKGRRVWVEIQEAPVVKDGKTISIVGAATDITERRWAEMALQISEKKYRDIVTWAPVGIYQSTLSGKLLSGNSRIAEMLGYDDVNELIGRNMGQTIYYDEKDWERFVAEDNLYK
jgi:PAS domain S-box-containing protein